MRGIMADKAEAVGAVAHDELDPSVAVEWIGEVRQDPVPLHGDRLLGEAGGDAFDHGGPGGATRIVAYCTVGERHLDHFAISISRRNGGVWALIMRYRAGKPGSTGLPAGRATGPKAPRERSLVRRRAWRPSSRRSRPAPWRPGNSPWPSAQARRTWLGRCPEPCPRRSARCP